MLYNLSLVIIIQMSSVDGKEATQDALAEDEEQDEFDDDDDNPKTKALPATNCLFCPCVSLSLEDNVQHMTTEHSFFIPCMQIV